MKTEKNSKLTLERLCPIWTVIMGEVSYNP